jgi:hypothetical protein
VKSFRNALLICVLPLCSPTSGLTDSRVVAWGYNWYVNGGPTQFRRVGAPPSDLTNAVTVTGGAGHDLALRADGTVRA